MRKFTFPTFGHGGDYNPDQWLDNPKVLAEDIELMKAANCNLMSVGIFAWAALEPREGEYTMDWLQDVIDRLYANGISVLLATPSGARPAWMSFKYPEVLRVREDGGRNTHGARHNHCFTSPVYRDKVAKINAELARRFGAHPGVVGWHISNEYGGTCYCPLCQDAFRSYLKSKYGTLDELNKRYWTAFWAHTYTDWSQIEPPMPHGEVSVMALNLDWNRFTTLQTVDFMRHEVAAIREICPDKPVTANFMGRYMGLDYSKFEDVIDFVSWDNYPEWGMQPDSDEFVGLNASLTHSLMRGLKPDRPWVLMESTPSQVNWQDICKLKRPGMNLLAGMQAVAEGADSVMYFQWRKGRGASEKLHGAVVDHVGHGNTRVFREVSETGEYLKKIQPVLGSLVRPRAALIYDCENRWALQFCQGIRSDKLMKYEQTINDHYGALKAQGIDVDVINSDAPYDSYDLLVAPMLYMIKPGVAERMKEFVRRGGQLVMTVMSGYADDNDLCFYGGFPGDGLSELLGIWVEETDGLRDHDKNRFVPAEGSDFDGEYECGAICDIMHAQGARVEYVYGDDFYKGMPCVTVNEYGNGKAWYVASLVDPAFLKRLYTRLVPEQGIPSLVRMPLAEGIIVSSRIADDGTRYIFVMNFDHKPHEVGLLPGCTNLLTGEPAGDAITLDGISGATLVYKG